ncbi:MAG TPA: glycine--tRNA ligase subunit beta [Polyangiaceae bacterium]|jgi:glycyl-tRNA synthetase beta chain|nr:glycine--tRNA ligase subunit beta [Polyangiaceae bacterium]
MSADVLLEIGVEELPASFVKGAIDALPGLLEKKLDELRLTHGEVRAVGTPRRLAVWASGVSERQLDLSDEVLGPPARVAFDADGKPTRAAAAFAEKNGVALDAVFVKETPKGAYVAAKRLEKGAPAVDLLPAALERVCAEIPFRKSMRWSDGDTAFGRPVRWLVALFGDSELRVRFAGLVAGRTTYGHRFLAPGPIRVDSSSSYRHALRDAHVLVDPAERREHLLSALQREAAKDGGTIIPDDFLVEENTSLVEEPYVFLGSFEDGFLALPERVILAVAKGHQRYFGVRGKDGKLRPRYLAVVNTLEKPENVIRGNDRVMRARLSDAKFFYTEDLKVKLSSRRPSLDGIVFHKRLGTVGDKVRRVERLVAELGAHIGLDAKISATALDGAALAKCDLVTLMVGELPELQGEMGRAYALAQGTAPAVADVIAEHYMPKGADDDCAPSDAGALVAIADRFDTLVGSCAVNVMPTGAADPLALRRAAIGVLRTLLARGWDVSVPAAVLSAHSGFETVKLDLDAGATADRLSSFLAQRLRGVLASSLPSDVVDACIAAGHDRPVDVVRRAEALSSLDPAVRATAGEVFKRVTNIAKDAPEGQPEAPERVSADVHPSEKALFAAFVSLRGRLEGDARGDHPQNLAAIAEFSPILARFFEDVFVMTDDEPVRNNRLRLMREIQRTCSSIANFNLLAKAPSA